MLNVHNVTPRICLPAVNQCPFCSFSRQTDAKTLRHINMCRALFRPNLNLYYPPSGYDMPLLATNSRQPLLMTKSRHNQPQCGARFPLNIMQASNMLVGNRSAVFSEAVTATSSALFAGVRPVVPCSSVPIPLLAALNSVMGSAVGPVGFATANTPSYPISLGNRMSTIAGGTGSHVSSLAPTRLTAVPVGIITSSLIAPSSFSNMTSSSLSAQNPSRSVTSGFALNFFNSVTGQTPVRKAFVQVNSAKVRMPNTTRHDMTSSVTSASHQTSSVSNNFGPGAANFPPYSVEKSSSSAKVVSSSAPSVSSVSKKSHGNVCSEKSPVVMLHQLTVSACEVCGSMFEKPLLMHRHLLIAHNIAVTEDGQGGLQCVCCPLRFFSKPGLNRHMQIVHELPSGEYSCPRCSETGIADLIEHFRVNHNVALRTMVEWRVCYLCKLNFSKVGDVERHVVSAHADIFPSLLHFRQRVRASLRRSNSTDTQTKKKRITSDTVSSEHVNRKRRHSVIEIADDNSPDLNSNDSAKVQATDEKRDSVGVSKTGTSSHSPGNEPARKKVRKSSSISVAALNFTSDEKTDQSKTSVPRRTAQEQHSASALEKGAVLGTISHVTKNLVLLPLTNDRRSSVNAAIKPTGIADVSVRLTPLASVHDTATSVEPQKKESTQSSGKTSSTRTGKSEISVPITPLNSMGSEKTSVERKRSCVDANKQAGMPDVSVRIMPLTSIQDPSSSVVLLKNGSTQSSDSTSNKHADVSQVSVPITPDVSVRLTPLNSLHDTPSSVEPLKKESTQSSDNTSSKHTGVSVPITPLTSLGSANEETSVEKDKGRYRFVEPTSFAISNMEVVCFLKLNFEVYLCYFVFYVPPISCRDHSFHGPRNFQPYHRICLLPW